MIGPTAGLREMGMPACQLAGRVPLRVARGCMRDNGMHSHDCARCGRYLDYLSRRATVGRAGSDLMGDGAAYNDHITMTTSGM